MNQQEINTSEWGNPDNWSGGFYFSKKDSRVWVPKSIPWMGLLGKQEPSMAKLRGLQEPSRGKKVVLEFGF